MTRSFKSLVECRLCGCKPSEPCTNPITKVNCRAVKGKVTVDSECAFCTNPELRSRQLRPTKPRIVGKESLNKKYVYRTDAHHWSGYQVKIPVAELGVNARGKTRSLCASFSDNFYGGRLKSFAAAMKYRDEAVAEFGLSLEPPVRVPTNPDVNIYWINSRGYYEVRINLSSMRLSEVFRVSTWLTREDALTAARHWRDLQRALFDLPPAPGAVPIIVDFKPSDHVDDSVQLEHPEGNNRRLITHYDNVKFLEAVTRRAERPEPSYTLSRSTAEDVKPSLSRRWANLSSSGNLQMSTPKRSRGKW